MRDELTITSTKKLRGEITVPGDKSISHRAVLIGSIAEGTTIITNFLRGEDCLSTIKCMRQLGVTIDVEGHSVTVTGKGQHLNPTAETLDAGNSGTTVRLLLGILAGQKFSSTLTGDNSLRSRPMLRVAEPLRQMGAIIEGQNGGDKLPLKVDGGNLNNITYEMPVASAQVKSAILLAALYANNTTTVIEQNPSRDHTELMLKQFGASITTSKGFEEEKNLGTGSVLKKNQIHEISLTSMKSTENLPNIIRLNQTSQLQGCSVYIPGDISSAAFFMVAAAIIPGSRVLLHNVGINPTRTGIIDVLKQMGADIAITEVSGQSKSKCNPNYEPVADILICGGNRLTSVIVEGHLIPRLIDEIPAITAAALFAEGTTVIKDAAELRVKESDRIAILARQLSLMGASIKEQPDGLQIKGGNPLKGCTCESKGDHRMAMTFAIAGLKASGKTTIKDSRCIEISYPSFFDDLKKLIMRD